MKIKDSQTGQVTKILPFIYRLAIFIPLGNKEVLEEEIEDEDEDEEQVQCQRDIKQERQQLEKRKKVLQYCKVYWQQDTS